MSSKLCDLCSKPAIQGCTKCKSVFYCGISHQLLLRPYHSKTCQIDPEIVINQPDLTLAEFRVLRPVLEEQESDFMISNSDFPMISKKDSEIMDPRFCLQLNLAIKKKTAQDRNELLTLLRHYIHFDVKLSPEELIYLSFSTFLSPFYGMTRLNSSLSDVSPEFIKQYFTHLCIEDLYGRTGNMIKRSYFEKSLNRLDTITNDLVKKGLDEDGSFISLNESAKIMMKQVKKDEIKV